MLKTPGRIVIADTMFRDEQHKASALKEYSDLEDEYQPLLTTFPAMFELQGLNVKMQQVGDLVWILVAEKIK